MNFRDKIEEMDRLYEKLLNIVIDKIYAASVKEYGSTSDVKERIERVTREAFGCGYWTENDYLHTLYGAISPDASFKDFEHYIGIEVDEIHDYFETTKLYAIE